MPHPGAGTCEQCPANSFSGISYFLVTSEDPSNNYVAVPEVPCALTVDKAPAALKLNLLLRSSDHLEIHRKLSRSIARALPFSFTQKR